MTKAGGPAAINGFLYQILHHLGWIAELSLSGTLDGSLVTEARLVLEPRHGGDARGEAAGVYLVEQYKSRKDGTWSVVDIVSVLGDLRKAVPQPNPPFACYRFVTDGRPGHLESLDTFLADVKSAVTPNDLDRVEKRKFSGELLLTHDKFFDHVVVASRAAGEVPASDERMTVFHLLRQLELKFGLQGDAQAAAVERLLRRYAPNFGEERGTRERLAGLLLEKLSKGEVYLDREKIAVMLRDVGLNPERLFRLAQLAETMGERTRRRLSRVGYRSVRDVRRAPDWPNNKPVLLIAGASGTGKTWQLGRLLENLAQSREIATLVPSTSTSEAVLQDAARDIWQTGLDETSEKTLIAIAHFLHELVPDANVRRITVAADDIQDVDVARALVRQDWTEWGMRLVMTVSYDLARALQAADSDRIHLHPVGDFSIDELDHLLRQNGQSWAELPPDLKKLLRAPILASLFLDLPYNSIQRAPRSEYEIFEAFWTRIALKGRPGDEGIVLALAASYVDRRPYPLPRQRWGEIGLTDDSRARLDAAGWLRVTEPGEIAFAHDRLLNWAVAKSLVHQHQRGDLNAEGLGDFLANGRGGEGQALWRRLGYVPMDTIWLLGEVEQNAESLSAIVARMEDSQEFGSYGEHLYTDLLPTLGQRAVPILFARLNTVISNGEGDYRVRMIGQAFASLARQDHVELAQLVAELLRSTALDRQSVAITVLTVSPDATCLDRLWEIHRRRVDALEEEDGARYDDYRASFAALRAGVTKKPQWLRQRILSADPQTDPVSELGYLLNGLDHAEAPAIWRETRDVLMAKVATNKPRSLLYCMARFGDREKIEFVMRHLSQPQDLTSGAALYALSVLDPRAAIDRLMEVSDAGRDFTRNQWLPGLLRAEPELTRQRVLALAKTEAKRRFHIETLFGERPDEMNAAMLRFVLRALEQDLRERLDAAIAGDPIWLDRPLRFLGSITRPNLLAILEAEAGGELERMITAVGRSRLRLNSNWRDHVLEGVRRFLILIGGEGITALLRQELESEHYWVRHGGLNWAFVRRDDGIIERLAALAHRPLPRDAEGKSESNAYFEFHQAMSRLAALGADSILVDVLLEGGVTEVPIQLASLRAHQGPMPNTLTERGVASLANEVATENDLRVALVIAWLSRNVDLVPTVRAVLEKADPASSIAQYACIALLEIGDRSEEFARLALGLARTKENAKWGLNGLASFGDRGAELLLEWLQSPGAASRATHEAFVIRELYAQPATRAQAVGAAAAVVRLGRQQHAEVPYDIAAEVSDPAVRDQVLDKAFAVRSFVVTEPLRAIKGLAKFDIARAVDAIELALQSHSKIESQLCQMLVRLAPEIAVEKLIRAAVLTERDSLRRAAGRALRRSDPAVVFQLLAEHMKSVVPERKAAAELAGWVPVPVICDALAELADHDSASEVRHAALLALERHRKEASLKALMSAFGTASYNKQWSLLTAILDGADPYLLKDHSDPLWLGHILTDKLPAVFEEHANNVLRQRMQREN